MLRCHFQPARLISWVSPCARQHQAVPRPRLPCQVRGARLGLALGPCPNMRLGTSQPRWARLLGSVGGWGCTALVLLAAAAAAARLGLALGPLRRAGRADGRAGGAPAAARRLQHLQRGARRRRVRRGVRAQVGALGRLALQAPRLRAGPRVRHRAVRARRLHQARARGQPGPRAPRRRLLRRLLRGQACMDVTGGGPADDSGTAEASGRGAMVWTSQVGSHVRWGCLVCPPALRGVHGASARCAGSAPAPCAAGTPGTCSACAPRGAPACGPRSTSLISSVVAL